MSISILNILGIHQGDVDYVWSLIEKEFETLHIKNERMDEVQERVEENKSSWDLDNITNSIISDMLEAACDIIESEYGNIEVTTYVNGRDSHITTTYDDFAAVLNKANIKEGIIKSLFKHDFPTESVLTKDQLAEIVNSGDDFEFLATRFSAVESDCLWENVASMGECYRDNGCRDEDEDDETFGEFLVQASKDGSSKYYFFKLSDGQIYEV